MPEIAPAGKPIAISWNVTQVCWIRSPEVKPVNKDERIRLGLLIKKGSIQRPDAISQRSKKPPDDTNTDYRNSEPANGKTTPALDHGAIECWASAGGFFAHILRHGNLSLVRANVQFVAKDIPQPAIGLVESFLPVNFKDVARPFHGHVDNIFDFTRPVSDDYHPVGKRNRFHQVVGDENDGLA